jgi:hypothetical protein
MPRRFFPAPLALLLAACSAETPPAAPEPGVPAAETLTEAELDGAMPPAIRAEAAPAVEPPARVDASSDAVVEGVVDPDGRLRFRLGDAAIVVIAECADDDAALRRCGPARVSVEREGATPQPVEVDALLLGRRATAYRGALDEPQDQAGRTAVLADVNADGFEDLALWTGTLGGYGSASFDVFLGGPDGFRRDDALSALTHGALGLFTIQGGRLVRTSKSGCCLFSTERYALSGDAPTLVEETIEDSTENRASPRITVRRRVDGQMQDVEQP